MGIEMTNTDRLIASLEDAKKAGSDHLYFYVGRYTGNGSSVVAALRRRGFTVDRIPSSSGGYRLSGSAS
jgi:hypothetical protein